MSPKREVFYMNFCLEFIKFNMLPDAFCAVHVIAVHFITVWCSAMKCGEVKCNAVEFSVIQFSAIWCSALLEATKILI